MRRLGGLILEWRDPPVPGQHGHIGTIYMAVVCDEPIRTLAGQRRSEIQGP